MNAFSRRSALSGLIGISAVTGLLLSSSPARAQVSVSIPTMPMRLSRQLSQSLRDGAMLSVRREWRVEFLADASGISITGEQLDAQVDAPAPLASLAQIEQSRSTADMWPIMLSSGGRILETGTGVNEADFAAAIEEAERFITSSPLPASEQAVRLQHLSAMQNAGSSMLDQLPEDLFFPVGTPRRSVRELELPGGMIGEFEATYDAKASSQGGWLNHATRQIATRIGDSERIALERWTLVEM